MSALGHSRTFAPLSVAEPRPRTPSGQIRSPRAVPSPWRGLTLCPREQSEPFASYLKPVAATGPPDAASVAVGGTPWSACDRHTRSPVAPFSTISFPERVVERPICSTCGAVMRLVWIAANKQDDPDRHTFECAACTPQKC